MKKEKTDKKTRFVVACRNSDGALSELRGNSGKTHDYEQVLGTVEQGMIENALPFTGRGGVCYIRGINDGGESTNLRNLEEF